MNYDPQTVLDALRALSAARDGSAPYERSDIFSVAAGARLFTVSTAGYVFTLFASDPGEVPRVSEWLTPDGVRVASADSLTALYDADWIVRPPLDTNFGLRTVAPEEVATAWRKAADFLINHRNRPQDATA